MSGDETLKLFDATMRLCGANLQTRIDGLIAFKQVIGMGVLVGDEFTQLVELNPYLMGILRESEGDETLGHLRIRARAEGIPAEVLTRVLHLNSGIITETSDALVASYEECVAVGMMKAGEGTSFVSRVASQTDSAKRLKRLKELLEGGL